ncbi:MAG: hypothetical protein JO086_02895 [Acidimicrobiia bacterium]|nr:hypothetical protein [Acidimicrobiia bacterium]
MSILDLAWRRRRFAVALVGTSVVLGLTLVLAGVNASFPNEAHRTIGAFHARSWVVPAGTSGPFMSSATLPASTASEFGADRGGPATPVAVLRGTLEHGNDRPDVNILGVVPATFAAPPVVDGRAPLTKGEATAERSLGVGIGDVATVNGHAVRVVGLTSGLTYRAGVPSVYVTLDEAQAIAYGGQPLATTIAVQGSPPSLPTGLILRSNDETFRDVIAPIKNARKTITLVLALLWVVAALVIGSVVYLSTIDRVRDIAVFKAIGATDRSLLAGVVVQALLLALTACAVGIVLARVIAPMMPMRAEIAGWHRVLLVGVAVAVAAAASVTAVRRVLSIDPAFAFEGA